MNTIVVADSDVVTRAALVGYLERQQSIPVTAVASREELYRQMTQKLLSLIIFDLRLEQDEFTLLRRIRERSNVPIIITADKRKRGEEAAGLELGADDYIVRPFGLRELLARIQALLRRSHKQQIISLGNSVSYGYRFGGWLLDCRTRCLTDPEGTRVSLTKREYRLLVAFLAAPGRTLTREQLIDSTQIHRDVLDRAITGSGTADPYGILIQQDPQLRKQSYHAIGIADRSKNIEVERVFMHNVDIGIVCETNADCGDSLNYPNWILDSMYFHDNKIVGTWNEGMYIGNTSPDNTSSDPRPVTCDSVTSYPAPMKNGYTKIYNNIVDSTGRGGIQLANAIIGVSEIYNNTVKHSGMNGDEGQGTGISVGLYANAYIHDNIISNTYTWGIASLGAGATNIPLRIEHNTIDSSGYLGHYNLDTTTRIVYDPRTESVFSDGLTWPQSIEVDTRPRHYTTESPHPGTAVAGQDSTQFWIRNNTIGLKKNTTAINVDDDYSGIQKVGNIICGNLNAGSGTAATIQVVSGISYSTDCSGSSSIGSPLLTGNPARPDSTLSAGYVKVYPNPVVQNTIILSMQNNKTGKVIVTLYDVNGKAVQENVFTKETVVFQQTLILQQSLHGMYLLKVQIAKENKPFIFKLIRE